MIGIIQGKLDLDKITGLEVVRAEKFDSQTRAGNIFDNNLPGAPLGNDLFTRAGDFDRLAIMPPLVETDKKAVAAGALYLDRFELFDEF
jgi:hypothetical protein